MLQTHTASAFGAYICVGALCNPCCEICIQLHLLIHLNGWLYVAALDPWRVIKQALHVVQPLYSDVHGDLEMAEGVNCCQNAGI